MWFFESQVKLIFRSPLQRVGHWRCLKILVLSAILLALGKDSMSLHVYLLQGSDALLKSRLHLERFGVWRSDILLKCRHIHWLFIVHNRLDVWWWYILCSLQIVLWGLNHISGHLAAKFLTQAKCWLCLRQVLHLGLHLDAGRLDLLKLGKRSLLCLVC